MFILQVAVMMLFSTGISCSDNDSLSVMFWNLENFFNYKDEGTGNSDKEFSAKGFRRWTSRRFYMKCDAICKSIMWIADNYGRIPDIIGFAEVENRDVLNRLINSTALRKYDYKIIHYDSADRRGIDVALIFRQSSLKYLASGKIIPRLDGEIMLTRNMLHVRFLSAGNDTIDVLTLHHPSKYGGQEASEPKREAAMKCLKSFCDSLSKEKTTLIVMGDFNDDPDGKAFEIIDDSLVNKGRILHEKGRGTIRYEGKWELIDMFLVNKEFDKNTEMKIIEIPFLMEYDKKYPGLKPLRTYVGPKYSGGVSDHCPIILNVF